jgi:hypothetical protein
MNANRERLGCCPICETGIPPHKLLIQYDADEEWPRMFAECPSCESVVHPR